MQLNRGLRFTGRPVENRKLSVVKAFGLTFKKFSYGELKQDAIVQLYGYEKSAGKNGKEVGKLFPD